MNVILDPDEVIAFDMYFASVCSMQYHPGAGTREHRRLSIEECRAIAIDMIVARRQVVETDETGGGLCHGQQ